MDPPLVLSIFVLSLDVYDHIDYDEYNQFTSTQLVLGKYYVPEDTGLLPHTK